MIALACVLTVVIEVPFLALTGYRDRDALTVTVCTNVITNLLLNLTLALAFPHGAGGWIYTLAALVVAAEYGIYAAAFGGSGRLFASTLAANCLSYGLGLLIF